MDNEKQLERLYTKLIPIILNQNMDPVIIAIDGKSAAGKTTLSNELVEKFDANLFHMDDYFLPEQLKTVERLKEIGGNVDYVRFKNEIIDSLLKKENVHYQKYICMNGTMEAHTREYKRVNIIEGAYSMHPYFQNPYAYCIFADIDSKEQEKRILKRNGRKMLTRFITEWIPKEEEYLSYYQIKKKSDIIVCL